MSKICFITAIYGGYERSCKKFVKQTVDTDFICFTDNKDIIGNGWVIDTTPYHLTNKSKLDDDTFINSLCNNKHNFNISKYYKQAFTNIPILDKYDVIVWLDGTIEITYDKTSEYVLDNIYKEKIIYEQYKSIIEIIFNSEKPIYIDKEKSVNIINHLGQLYLIEINVNREMNKDYESRETIVPKSEFENFLWDFVK